MRFRKRLPIPWRMALAATICGSVCLSGCALRTRTILVPPGEPVRIRKTLKDVPIWAADKDGKEVEGTADLPEGWYALPDPGPGSKR